MNAKLGRIEKWLKGEKAEPWHMQLQPTARCNLRCQFCWTSLYKRHEKELSDKKWMEITKEACEMDVNSLTIVGGGEPLLRRELIKEMAKIIKEHGIWGTIVTNGTLFTSEFVKHLVEIGWDSIAISIDGASSRTDNYLRGHPQAHEMSLKSVDMINEWKSKLSLEKPNIVFHTVITRQNVHELLEMIKLAKKLKAGTFVLKMVNDDFSNPRFFISKEEFELLESQIQNVVEFSKQEKIDLDWQMNLEDVRRILFKMKHQEGSIKKERLGVKVISCSRPFSEMAIIPDGTVGPCCAFCEGKYSERLPAKDQKMKTFHKQLFQSTLPYVDDIRNKSLFDIWEGDTFNRFRELVKNGDVPFFCKSTCPLDYVYLEDSGKISIH